MKSILLMVALAAVPADAAYKRSVGLSLPWGKRSSEIGLDRKNMRGPFTFAVASDGAIAVEDGMNGRVAVFSQAGALLGSIKCRGAWDVAFAADGSLLVVSETLSKFARDGTKIWDAAIPSTSTARNLRFVTEESSGDLMVVAELPASASASHSRLRFSADGKYLATLASWKWGDDFSLYHTDGRYLARGERDSEIVGADGRVLVSGLPSGFVIGRDARERVYFASAEAKGWGYRISVFSSAGKKVDGFSMRERLPYDPDSGEGTYLRVAADGSLYSLPDPHGSKRFTLYRYAPSR